MFPNDPTSPWFIVNAAIILVAWYFIGAFFITRFGKSAHRGTSAREMPVGTSIAPPSPSRTAQPTRRLTRRERILH